MWLSYKVGGCFLCLCGRFTSILIITVNICSQFSLPTIQKCLEPQSERVWGRRNHRAADERGKILVCLHSRTTKNFFFLIFFPLLCVWALTFAQGVMWADKACQGVHSCIVCHILICALFDHTIWDVFFPTLNISHKVLFSSFQLCLLHWHDKEAGSGLSCRTIYCAFLRFFGLFFSLLVFL